MLDRPNENMISWLIIGIIIIIGYIAVQLIPYLSIFEFQFSNSNFQLQNQSTFFCCSQQKKRRNFVWSKKSGKNPISAEISCLDSRSLSKSDKDDDDDDKSIPIRG